MFLFIWLVFATAESSVMPIIYQLMTEVLDVDYLTGSKEGFSVSLMDSNGECLGANLQLWLAVTIFLKGRLTSSD